MNVIVVGYVLVSETIIVRLFQCNYYCYCDYYLLIILKKVRFILRSTFHITLVDLCCIIFQCKLYIYPVSCLV